MKIRKIGPVTHAEASYLMGKNAKILNPMQFRASRAVLISFIVILLMSCLNILAGIGRFRDLREQGDNDFYVRGESSSPEEAVVPSIPAALPKDRPLEPEGTVREHRKHITARGDSFYSITIEYWGEKWFWPGMYYNNRFDFPDPDLLHPGDEITVFPSPGELSDLSQSALEAITLAYLYVYERYRALETNDKARWALYSAYKVNPRLLDDYADRIASEDRRILEEDIERFPPSRY